MKTAKRQLSKDDAALETTKRLESIMASFDAFDADMRIGTRQRREKDEFKVFTMQQQMAVLERSLHNEVKKRTEMTKSIKTWCDSQVAEMRTKFQHDVNERRIKLQERVDGLRERTNDMRRRFTVDMHAIPLDIEARGKHWPSGCTIPWNNSTPKASRGRSAKRRCCDASLMMNRGRRRRSTRLGPSVKMIMYGSERR